MFDDQHLINDPLHDCIYLKINLKNWDKWKLAVADKVVNQGTAEHRTCGPECA